MKIRILTSASRDLVVCTLPYLFARQHHQAPLRLLFAGDSIQPRQFYAKHITVEKQNSREGQIPGTQIIGSALTEMPKTKIEASPYGYFTGRQPAGCRPIWVRRARYLRAPVRFSHTGDKCTVTLLACAALLESYFHKRSGFFLA